MKGISVIKTGFGKFEEFGKQGIQKFNSLDKKKKMMIGGGGAAAIVIIGSLYLALGRHNEVTQNDGSTGQNILVTQNQLESPIVSRLDSIEDQIQKLQSQQDISQASMDQINRLNSSLDDLRQSVANLQQTSPHSVSEIKSVVVNGNQDINDQLSQIKKVVEQIKKQSVPKHYLPASALPWAVDGVDVRNYQPVVIRADGFGAINQGEIRDGWKLIQVEFNPPLAVFQNVQQPDQYVKVQPA